MLNFTMLNLRNRLALSTVALSVAATLLGCVPAEQYEGMKMKADQYAEQLAQAQAATAAAQAAKEADDKALAAMNNSQSASTAVLSNEQQQREELQRQNEEKARQIDELRGIVGRVGQQQALPTPLTDELRQFAATSSDLIDFDAARGVVKFKSDVVFPPGDTTVAVKAKDTLNKFAAILDSASASQYDLLVAGHTDSTPVINKATIAKGNFDNWYLSSHRAIAVGKELIADGVGARRVGMVGYADQRPIPGGSNAANRRVEVIILPTVSHGSSSGGYAARARRAAAATPAEPLPAADVITKDGGPSKPTPTAPPMPNK